MGLNGGEGARLERGGGCGAFLGFPGLVSVPQGGGARFALMGGRGALGGSGSTEPAGRVTTLHLGVMRVYHLSTWRVICMGVGGGSGSPAIQAHRSALAPPPALGLVSWGGGIGNSCCRDATQTTQRTLPSLSAMLPLLPAPGPLYLLPLQGRCRGHSSPERALHEASCPGNRESMDGWGRACLSPQGCCQS